MIPLTPPRLCLFGKRQHNPETKVYELVDTTFGLCYGFGQEITDGRECVVAVVKDNNGDIHTPSVWCTRLLPTKLTPT